MPNQKAALLSCKSGHWVRTAGMHRLYLDAQLPAGCTVMVQQLISGREAWIKVETSGRHLLEEAEWTRLEVTEGPFMGTLCVLRSREAA